jgi:hypothetical protein
MNKEREETTSLGNLDGRRLFLRINIHDSLKVHAILPFRFKNCANVYWTKSRKPCFALQETMSKAFTSLFLKRFTHKDLVTNYHQNKHRGADRTRHLPTSCSYLQKNRVSERLCKRLSNKTSIPECSIAAATSNRAESRSSPHEICVYIYFLNHKKFHNVPLLLFLLRRHLRCVSAPSVAPKFASNSRWIL